MGVINGLQVRLGIAGDWLDSWGWLYAANDLGSFPYLPARVGYSLPFWSGGCIQPTYHPPSPLLETTSAVRTSRYIIGTYTYTYTPLRPPVANRVLI